MSDFAIKVDNLSKRYRIGFEEKRHDTLVGAMTTFLRQPGKNLQRLRRLTTFSNAGQGDESDVIWALKDISFEVQRGEVVGIIGRNGAGKSTLLKILSRITHPTSGRVELNGRVSSLLEVGTGFHPELTGRENIYLNGTILGMTKAEVDRKFDKIVDFSGVEKFIDTPVKFYSSGMRVRLAFSVAAHLEPEILLIDEVLAVGDSEFQKKCLGKMGDIANQGRTVLFVSHNMPSITRLCEWSMRIHEGRIYDIGNSRQVVEKYLLENTKSISSVELLSDQTKPMCLRRVTVINHNGEPSDQLDIGKPFRVKIEYEINEIVASSHVICFIQTQEGVNVFGTGDADNAPYRLNERKPGYYSGEFEVPALLLGESYYTITVSLGIPFIQVFDRHPDLIGFQVVDYSSERRKWQHQRRPGILGLEFSWEYVNEPVYS